MGGAWSYNAPLSYIMPLSYKAMFAPGLLLRTASLCLARKRLATTFFTLAPGKFRAENARCRLAAAEFGLEMTYFKPEMTCFKSETTHFKPETTHFKPEETHFKPADAPFKPENGQKPSKTAKKSAFEQKARFWRKSGSRSRKSPLLRENGLWTTG